MNENHDDNGQKAEQRQRESDKTGSCRHSNRKWASQKGEAAERGRGNILTNILWKRSRAGVFQMNDFPFWISKLKRMNV